MKIAIIGSAYPFRGGIANFTDRLAKAFQEEGEEVTIYTFTLQYPNFLFPGKSQYSEDPPPKHLKIEQCINSINPFNWLWVGNKIRKACPDLVIVKFWLPFMGPCFGTILRIIKRNRHSRIISFVHNMIPHEKRPGDRLFSKYFVKPVDAFLAMSNSVLEDVGQFDKTKPRAFSPHPLYDNFGEIEPREKALDQLGLDKDFQYILFFGLIRTYKGLDLLIQAFADERIKTQKIKLIIAGEYYDQKEKYQQLIKDKGISEKVIQVDHFIPDSEVANYFNACDLVVQPYKSATQSGVTQIAYHFNKPMIVTDVGGLKEMCPDGKVGYVTAPEPKAISNAIIKFFTDTDRVEMTENIIGEKEKYSWEILTRAVYTLARKI
jgi:glycosyltransferase involved in cell wall biosynthesis